MIAPDKYQANVILPNIKLGKVISLVGGGGKTTLMFALARKLAIGEKLSLIHI